MARETCFNKTPQKRGKWKMKRQLRNRGRKEWWPWYCQIVPLKNSWVKLQPTCLTFLSMWSYIKTQMRGIHATLSHRWTFKVHAIDLFIAFTLTGGTVNAHTAALNTHGPIPASLFTGKYAIDWTLKSLYVCVFLDWYKRKELKFCLYFAVK